MILHRFQLGEVLIGALEASHENYSEDSFLISLPPAERELSKKFKHPIRRLEFLAGRAMLHILEPALPPVLSSDNGMPIWEGAFTGSVSHKNGWVLSCVSSTQKFRSIGIDLEEPAKFPLDVAKVICVPDEMEFLDKSENQRDYLSLLFSCKESLFKCCYPICRTWFGFQDAKLLSYEASSGIFQIQLLKELSPDLNSGRIFNGHFKHETWNGRRFIITSVILSS